MPTLTSSDGTTIAYDITGDGPALILVDGAMCFRDAGPMRPIADLLAASFTVILYDRRGRGASTDTLPFSVEREIDDLAALIDVADGSAALFGISSGAALVLAAAAVLGPDKVTRIALYEPPFMPEPAIAGAAAYTAELSAALAAGHRDEAVQAFLRRVGMPSEAVEGMRHSPGWAASVALAPTLAYDDAAMGDSRVPVARAQGLRIPALTLAGGASPAFLQYGAREVAEAMPNARFEVVPGQTHDIAASAVAPLLTTFVAG